MKRKISVFVSVLMLGVMLAGCDGGGGSPSGQNNQGSVTAGDRSEQQTISIALWDAEGVDDAIGKIIEEELNIKLEMSALSWDNPEQVRLYGATDSLPDIVGTYPADELAMFYSWIDQGLIRDIPAEMIAKYPRVQKIVDDAEVLNSVKMVKDDKYWYLPRPESLENIYIANWTAIYYRKDWMQNVGIETAPRTMDEFYEMLKAFKEKDPDGNGINDTIPLSIQSFPSGTPNDLFASWGVETSGWYKNEAGDWVPGYYMDEMIEPLKYFRKLYSEGLLDPEFTTVSRNQMIQLFSTNMAGAIMRNADTNWTNRVIFRSYGVANPEVAAPLDNIDLLLPLEVTPGTKAVWPQHIPTCGSYISSKVDDAKLDRILDLFEYLMSPETLDLFHYGIEGETFQFNAAGEKELIFTSEGETKLTLANYPSVILNSLAHWDFDYAADPNVPNDNMPGIREFTADFRERNNAFAVKQNLVPRMVSTPAKDDLQIDVGDKFMQIIIGDRDVEAMFADFQAECRNLGVEAAIDEVTAEMNRLGQ